MKLGGRQIYPSGYPYKHSFYRYEVTALVRQGINAITVRVSNTSANRRGTPQASGLLGPVRMILIR